MRMGRLFIIGLALCGMFFALGASAAAAAERPIGRITKLKGAAMVVHNGRELKARVGRSLYEKDVVKTQRGARLRITLKDNSIVSVDENSTIDLAEYKFEPQKKRRRAFFNMMSGKIRVFANRLAGYKTKSFRVKTPTAICGVRGTVFMIEIVNNVATIITCFDSQVQVANNNDPTNFLILDAGLKTQILGGDAPTQPIEATDEEIEQFKQELKEAGFVIEEYTEPETTEPSTSEAPSTEASTTAASTTSSTTTSSTTSSSTSSSTSTTTTTTTSTTTTTTTTTTSSTSSTSTVPTTSLWQLPGPPGLPG